VYWGGGINFQNEVFETVFVKFGKLDIDK
jgi:hypothetical protein